MGLWGVGRRVGGQAGVSSSLCAPEQVHAFDKKLEEMSNQVLQWQKQHQSDLKMLAAKEEQLRSFQEEMATLKENLLADEKDVGAPRLLATSSQLLPALPTATWLPHSPWRGVEVPGSKERHLLYSAQSRVWCQPSPLPVALLIEIFSKAKAPFQGRKSAIPLSGTLATPVLENPLGSCPPETILVLLLSLQWSQLRS